MKSSIYTKLQTLVERHEEITHLLSDADVIADQKYFRELSKEYSQLESVVSCFSQYRQCLAAVQENEVLLEDSDAEIRQLAEEDLRNNKEQAKQLENQLQLLLIPKDPDDDRNIYLEIRAGTGGNEASLFAGDLFRMYARYAEQQGWHLEVISSHDGEQGGFKEIISKISGQGVYAQLKFESGAHRVQRVPVTESQGRIHTSACTVAIMPEVDEIDEIIINPDELRIDTYRASGAGGQHVNKTDSAIRITHIPTGTVVECQDERSQHKNRAKALSLLQSKILVEKQTQQRQQQADTRRNLVGSGDRSERIRTYNFPQGRLTDHRINLTLYKLNEIMDGSLQQVIQPLIQEYQTDQLAALGLADEK